ncbi:MAG: hypothetical protein F8N38_21205 [Hungatella sp.]|nr:hypothetical protein [Hungatella sp.]
MQKRKNYIGKGNTELDPKINPSDRILYEFEDAQRHIYSSIRKDINENITKNILLGGVRGCGKSSLVNLAADFEKNLVVKIDCSIVDEEADLLTLIVNELKKILDSSELRLDDKLSKEVNELIREITFCATNVYKVTAIESAKEESQGIADFVAEFCMPLKLINLKSSIQARLKEVLVSKKDKTEEILQQRVTAYFERKTAFGSLIDKVNEASGKKLVFIFDEIDKHNVDFLDNIFDKYKSFLTSGKSTNIFLINLSQYYHIICGNACDNISAYFDKKYFLRAASFRLFKDISYNDIRSSVDLEINYYLNQGIYRNIYADMDDGNRDKFLLLKSKYYIKLAEFVNSCDELDDFVKEILVSVLNKVLKRGIIGNSINLNNLKQICSEEFFVFKNIQLQELILYILKSHAANTENWIILKEDEVIVDYDIFEEKYIKELYNNSDNENSSRYWENYKKETELAEDKTLYVYDSKFREINDGQIKLDNYEYLNFLLIDDSNNSHEDIIKTLLFETDIVTFIRVKKKNSLGFEFGYILFIDSSIKGRYVLYYDNASWSYEYFKIKEKIDNFILANRIKEIEIEVDSNFKASKYNLQHIVDKFNQHENITKDWIGLHW